MAGQHATLISEVPARRGVSDSWSGTPRVQYLPLGIVDRDRVIDAATIRYRVAEGSALTVTLTKAASGTGPSSGTAITGTADCNSTVHTNASLSLTTTKGVPDENIVLAGSTLYAKFSGAPATLDDFVFTYRWSDRMA